jgi:hypothetical protein
LQENFSIYKTIALTLAVTLIAAFVVTVAVTVIRVLTTACPEAPADVNIAQLGDAGS